MTRDGLPHCSRPDCQDMRLVRKRYRNRRPGRKHPCTETARARSMISPPSSIRCSTSAPRNVTSTTRPGPFSTAMTPMSSGRTERTTAPFAGLLPFVPTAPPQGKATRPFVAVPFRMLVRPRNSAVKRCRGEREFVRIAHLDDASGVHQHDPVGERHRFRLIVRHVDRRHPEPTLQRADVLAELLAKLRVEVGERLVEKQHIRLDDERACQRHTLLLTAGKLARISRAQGRKIDQAKRCVDPARASARVTPRMRRPKPTFVATLMCGKSA